MNAEFLLTREKRRELEVVEIERVAGLSILQSGGQHPDKVVVGVALDLEAFFEGLPLRSGTERVALQHRVVFVFGQIRKTAEVDDKRFRRMENSIVIRTDLGIERDFHLSITGQDHL